ncbi:MAG TPA: Sir2 family NAD-dependent protein deacetylase [Abditibacteriaceae bacterium]|jgi:NAD-dependent SIR2 family protein deacetylase
MNEIEQAAQIIAQADALVIAAGAGMGVDSGLPDFRGPEGFWRAYPPFAELGLRFEQVAEPRWFVRDPALAWGFYGHRYNLYQRTTPHSGFGILQQWAQRMKHGAHVFTSNVDGHFQNTGFAEEQVYECHGSLHFLQCVEPCCEEIWPVGDLAIVVDEETFRAEEPLPLCPYCGELARPNVLMFSDGRWLWNRSETQRVQFETRLAGLENARLVVIECGAGTAIPSVRLMSESLQRAGADLIRINPREAQGPNGTLSISTGAREALEAINSVLQS